MFKKKDKNKKGKKKNTKIQKIKKGKKNKQPNVILEKINWDHECKKDISIGRGFRITEPVIKNNEKCKNGAHSPKFCSDWADENAFAERYRCTCGDLMGKMFEGDICPKCKTVVDFKDVDLSITGWMIINDHCVIHPIYYNKLCSLIGEAAFVEILSYGKKVTKDGQLKLIVENPKGPYSGIGMTAFHERFDEIMQYYKKKMKNKRELWDEIISEADNVFTHCIPVYSSVLRTLSYQGDNLFYTTVDKKYNNIFVSIRLLNDENYYKKRISSTKERQKRERLGPEYRLASIQSKLMDVWKLVFEQINQKEGLIKEEILGGMVSFSNRSVIIPDPHLRSDKVIVSYMCFIELYKYEIIGCLIKTTGMTENEAAQEWGKARTIFNPRIYQIMKYIIKRSKPKIIINRNPTINYGSMLLMTICDVTDDIDLYTMSLPPQILAVMNADFDGDVLNVISMKSLDIAKAYDRVYNPRKNFFISRNDSEFNDDFNLFKDQIIGLYQFNNI